MHRNRFLTFVLILSIFFAGCASLERKFTRKKKEEEKLSPVITTYDYSKDLRVDELYKKHFLYWKTWQSELIEKMDASVKKRSSCYEHTLMHLVEMEKYLIASKTKELEKFIARIKSIDPDIRKKRLSKSEKYRLRRLLEQTMRQIGKRFSYSDVKGSLELKK